MKLLKTLLTATFVFFLVSCQETEKPKDEPAKVPTAEINYEGVSIVIMQETQKALGSELKAAMQRGGVAEAVGYCNHRALPITDSIAKRYNANIKRVTDKPRNPKNKANDAELAQLKKWRELQTAGDARVVTAVETDNSRDFFMPINMQPLCLNCHGVVGETLTSENAALIADKYPNDMATGYSQGELRGLWHISFAKQVK